MRKLTDADNIDSPTADYPKGRTRDKTGSTAGTTGGEVVLGDIVQFFQKLVIDAGITENDLSDNTTNGYQLVEALIAKINETSLNKKVIEIGDWDMDADSVVTVAHGVADFKKIRTVSAVIRTDSDNPYYILNSDPASGGSPQGWVDSIGSVDITLQRKLSGFYDTINFNSTSFNRGWVTIEYET